MISSIGSIPLEIPGIPMKGELFAFSDWDLGRLPGYPRVFSAGNVVTGKGNIVASRKHARELTEQIAASFLGLADDGHAGEAEAAEMLSANAREQAERIAEEIMRSEPITAEALAGVRERVGARQQAVGYSGDYEAWVAG